jgi:hypothetical protein
MPILAQENTKKKTDLSVLAGSYLGQKPPGMTPEIFASGIVSIEGREYSEGDINFWPDGNRCIFSRFGEDIPDFTIFELENIDGIWTIPEKSKIFTKGAYLTCISPDGKEIVFTSSETAKSWPPQLYIIRNENGKWTSPVPLCLGMYPSMTKTGKLYYTDGQYIVCRERTRGMYQEKEIAGKKVFTNFNDGHPFIAPDESFIIYDTNDELFISFSKGNKLWTKPKKMGIKGIKARMTYDGKYLFFHRDGDIYWINAKVINKFSHK